MNTLEQPPHENVPDFGMDFGMENEAFDVHAAFEEALRDVVNDTELALDEKVRRMEFIVHEGASEVYRDFVDFRQMAAHIQMMCTHDHSLQQSLSVSETLTSFIEEFGGSHDGHDHDNPFEAKRNGHDSEYEVDPFTGKKTKKKKRRGWFGVWR